MPPPLRPGTRRPQVVILAGPNGAGKSTTGPELLRGPLAVGELVNADLLAAGLSGLSQHPAPFEAGRIALARLRELARQRRDFAFETTLAGRSFARWLRQLTTDQYRLHLLFLWLPSAELAVQRVAARVRAGGHDVPKPVIRRRYDAGLVNLFRLYMPIATTWRFYDNSGMGSPTLLAYGEAGHPEIVLQPEPWRTVCQMVRDA